MGHPLDARSDIFSFGSVIYEWITGYKLFTGENEMAILKSIIDGKIYPPSYFKEDVPEAVERILMKALDKDKTKRYQSAWEMQFDIDTYLASSEFTPSNIHLSNFLKQIFGDEIEREKELLLKHKEESDRNPRQGHGGDEEILELEEVGGRALTDSILRGAGDGDSDGAENLDDTSNGRRGTGTRPPPRPKKGGRGDEATLTLQLSADELDALQRIAARNKVSVEHVTRELLRSHVRWHLRGGDDGAA
jgi:serine/threonine-protein kinase